MSDARHADMVQRMEEMLALVRSRGDALGLVVVVLLPSGNGHDLQSRYAYQNGAELPLVGGIELMRNRLGDAIMQEKGVLVEMRMSTKN